ncbi:hypothetical protein COB80_01135 [Candidatus Kaiserbacteria bacterium]|nr:MAG: hypothetical protein COB80_01135 [Candidatus Kaiserbacteria bacterium]
MKENIPSNSIEDKKSVDKQLKIALAMELFEGGETFLFPGIRPESYTRIKTEEAEFPGYSTPIDELLKRFENEGLKVVLGKNPGTGNIFVLPAGSDDIENDSLFPKHLSTEGDIDERLLKLIGMA